MPRAVPCPLTAGTSAARQAAPFTTAASRVPGGLLVARASRWPGWDATASKAGEGVDGAGLVLWREPDDEVKARRAAHLVAQEPTDSATVDAAHDLADQVAVEECGFAVSRSRRPLRSLRREQRAAVHPSHRRGRSSRVRSARRLPPGGRARGAPWPAL